MFKLDKLTSLVKKRKRIGRGGSRGGTSGRGHKGQKARSGGRSNVGIAFEGGQMPLIRRLPKRGFSNAAFTTRYEIFNLSFFDTTFEDGTTVTKELLRERGFIKGKGNVRVKVLADGSLSKKLIIHADAASKKAADLIQSSGGELHVTTEK